MPRRIVAKKDVDHRSGKVSTRDAAKALTVSINRQKKYGIGSVVQATEIVDPPARYSTGSLGFDQAMFGGFPANQWTEIVGNESSGKTTLTLKSIAESQSRIPGFTVIWLASEGWDPSLARMCGVDLEGVFVIEDNVMESAFEQVLMYVEARACDMVVIDSYPAMVTLAEDDGSMEDFNVGGGARQLNKFMRKCTKASKRSLTDPEDTPFCGVIINQWREKIGVQHGDPRTTPGGKGKNFWMYCRLDVRRDEWIVDEEKERVGQTIKITVMKMKGARPQQVGSTDFYFSNAGEFRAGEYDIFKAIINLAESYDLLERRGNGFVTPDGVFLNSRAKLREAIASDLDWRASIEAQVLDIAKNGRAQTEPLSGEAVIVVPAGAAEEEEEAVVVASGDVDEDELQPLRRRQRRATGKAS